MTFIYHRFPDNMTGNTSYPMSELLEIFPDLFAARQKIHEFQPHVLEGSIPRLGCFWNDTLHFTALHPQKIAESLKKFGYNIKPKYFEIDATRLSSDKTIVFLNRPRMPGTKTTVADFIDYNYNEIDKLAYIPEEALDRFKKIPTADEFLLNYGAPYILYKGRLDISGLKVIEA